MLPSSTLDIIGLTFHTLGEVIVAIMALSVHHRVRHEHKIDDYVFNLMKREWQIGGLGVLLIVAGFSLELVARLVR